MRPLIALSLIIMVFAQSHNDQNTPYKFDNNGRVIIPNKDILSKLPKDGGEFFNRLVFENSPYLLQHAANPVDWYPWGKEAFDTAKILNKPVFLSIGYSTCHWCHVMEEESFEDKDIALLMNDAFICVKVDREERPDLDNVYMEVTQMMNNRGGWPMNVILTPDKEAFYAATYIPKESRHNRTGMRELIPQIKDLWINSKADVIGDAKEITQKLNNQNQSISSYDEITPDVMRKAFEQFNNSFDEKWGGFGKSPKFPKAHDYIFLTKYFKKTGSQKALKMIEKSLTEMRRGGMYDQIGFGFHRYSTDIRWLVPHFEKMLYDQAILTIAYLEAYEATGNNMYSKVAKEILEYVMRDMTSIEGGFFSAEDADSEGIEGKFYVWSKHEIENILGYEDANIYNTIFNINSKGNSTVEGHRTNIPHLTNTFSELADRLNIEEKILLEKNENFRIQLYHSRNERIHPYKDDKILTDWNGLMIVAFSKAAIVLKDDNYKKVAVNAMDFILESLVDEKGRLIKMYRNGISDKQAVLDDYAFIIWALIELYHLTFDIKYLIEASNFADYQYEHFWDWDANGFFFTSDQSEELIVRIKEIYDGAIPSGNSVSVYNYIRLGRLLSRSDYDEIAYQIVESFGKRINRFPKGYSMMLQGIDYLFGPSYEVVIFGDENNINTMNMINTVRDTYQPNKVVLFGGMKDDNITEIIPFLNNYPLEDNGNPIVYVCKNYVCRLPTSSPDIVKTLLFE